jgi:hypothetical protein
MISRQCYCNNGYIICSVKKKEEEEEEEEEEVSLKLVKIRFNKFSSYNKCR